MSEGGEGNENNNPAWLRESYHLEGQDEEQGNGHDSFRCPTVVLTDESSPLMAMGGQVASGVDSTAAAARALQQPPPAPAPHHATGGVGYGGINISHPSSLYPSPPTQPPTFLPPQSQQPTLSWAGSTMEESAASEQTPASRRRLRRRSTEEYYGEREEDAEEEEEEEDEEGEDSTQNRRSGLSRKSSAPRRRTKREKQQQQLADDLEREDAPPLKTCCHRIFIMLQVISAASNIAMIFAQVIPLFVAGGADMDWLQRALRAYITCFCFFFIAAEMEWTRFYPSILDHWLFRGFLYTFVGTVGMQQSRSVRINKTVGRFGTSRVTVGRIAAIFVDLSSWVIIFVGVVYFALGLCCMKRVRDNAREYHAEQLEDYRERQLEKMNTPTTGRNNQV